ncbi:N-6 DNA methylase [Ruminococcus sp. 5_1_39BFAA]|uniref:type I restriction-modification system subunit M n=1 Tax=Ruminococcus sp. 5_1_39BFAA TaxID=457412 RepID=UPI00356409E6
MANDKFTVVGTNIAEKATMIWNVADMLRGPFKPHEYGLVILPMTVVKRFHDCLVPTHQAVLDTWEKVKKFAVVDGFLTKASGYQFYNTSKFTFDALLADPENIEANFKDYLNGFSANVQDVLSKFDFDNVIKRMVESNTLYLVIKEYNSQKGYLGPDKISAVDCGYIFEDLVKRFSESFGEEAGAHFTSRDVIYLMTDILLSDADLSKGGNVTVYDMAMGTSQMLSCMEERVHELNADIDVTCFGQEFNPSTFAIAKADMMIRGGDPNNMRFGDTLSEDQFSGYQFQYIISNPPFGIDWKREQKAVEAEAKKGELGRFAPGLPKISDGQQLFVLNGLSKLANNGKMAIIQNASAMFSGDAGSGSSNIRKYIIENDWLDAIIELSTDQFMNTGIGTYIWIIDKNKKSHRRGKVQLIDASHCYEPRRRPIGTKRCDISDDCRKMIVAAYGEFRNSKIYGDLSGIYCESKIVEASEFGYRKVVIERPLLDDTGKIIKKNGKPIPNQELRDTEMIPLTEKTEDFMSKKIYPLSPDAWIDEKKTKIGYEISMTKYFFRYSNLESVNDVIQRIKALEENISSHMRTLFGEGSIQ